MYNNQYQGQDRYGFTPLDGGRSLVNTVSSTMKRVYFKMTLALIVTALTALGCANNGFLEFMYANSWMMWVLIIAEFGLVFGISAGINKMSSTIATALFYLFAVVNGLMLSSIFVVYSPTAIVKTFFITAGTFGAMSVYGYFTSQDLSIAGVLIFIGLTAWDTQQIKAMAQAAPQDSVGRLATLGALSLYLDFINLFLYLLRIFGNRD